MTRRFTCCWHMWYMDNVPYTSYLLCWVICQPETQEYGFLLGVLNCRYWAVAWCRWYNVFMCVPDEMKTTVSFMMLPHYVKLYVCDCWVEYRFHVACVRNPVWTLVIDVCWQVKSSATGRSLVQRSLTVNFMVTPCIKQCWNLFITNWCT